MGLEDVGSPTGRQGRSHAPGSRIPRMTLLPPRPLRALARQREQGRIWRRDASAQARTLHIVSRPGFRAGAERRAGDGNERNAVHEAGGAQEVTAVTLAPLMPGATTVLTLTRALAPA